MTGAFTPKELAAMEQVSVASVYSWIRSGLPALRRGRLGNIVIRYCDYLKWMQESFK